MTARAGELASHYGLQRPAGPINGERFLAYVEQFLVPTLRPGDVVVLDNLGSHKEKAVRRAIRAVGARLLFLPKYSPDLNPCMDGSCGSRGSVQANRSVAAVYTASNMQRELRALMNVRLWVSSISLDRSPKVLRSEDTSFAYERDVQPRPKLGRWMAELDRLLTANTTSSARERSTLTRFRIRDVDEEATRLQRKRRSWSLDEKRRIVDETSRDGASIAEIARRHDLNANQLFGWRRQFGFESNEPKDLAPILPVTITPDMAAEESDPGSSGQMEIVLAAGDRVLVWSDVETAALTRVLKALSRR